MNSKLEVICFAEVKFDDDLGEEFEVSGGVCQGVEKHEYHVNPVMWVKALGMGEFKSHLLSYGEFYNSQISRT